MYKVKFYHIGNTVKKDHLYLYLFRDKELIYKSLTFTGLVGYLEYHKIDFKQVKFCCSLSDLFYHIVDYKSVQRFFVYDKYEDEKIKMLGDDYNERNKGIN